VEVAESIVSIRKELPKKPKRAPVSKTFIFLMLVLLLVGGAGYAYVQGYLAPETPAGKALNGVLSQADPYLLKLAEKFPPLRKWISPIPSLPNVDPLDYEALRGAAGSSLEKEGPHLALALATDTVVMPSFYVASNLPDHTQFQVEVEGVYGTLTEPGEFRATSPLETQGLASHLGKTVPIRTADQKAPPKGKYTVFVYESDANPDGVKALISKLPASNAAGLPEALRGKKLVAVKSYFLGGNNDKLYPVELKRFHDKVGEEAKREIAETKQFALTLNSQLTESLQKFAVLRSGKSSPKGAQKRSQWNAFNRSWSTLETGLNQQFQAWTPEVLQKTLFHNALYKDLQDAGAAVQKVHELENSYFNNSVDLKSFDIQYGQLQSHAQTAVTGLMNRINQVEQTPPTDSGLPKREGL
jgi:hypothetical protein